jgi:hypothetical protein
MGARAKDRRGSRSRTALLAGAWKQLSRGWREVARPWGGKKGGEQVTGSRLQETANSKRKTGTLRSTSGGLRVTPKNGVTGDASIRRRRTRETPAPFQEQRGAAPGMTPRGSAWGGCPRHSWPGEDKRQLTLPEVFPSSWRHLRDLERPENPPQVHGHSQPATTVWPHIRICWFGPSASHWFALLPSRAALCCGSATLSKGLDAPRSGYMPSDNCPLEEGLSAREEFLACLGFLDFRLNILCDRGTNRSHCFFRMNFSTGIAPHSSLVKNRTQEVPPLARELGYRMPRMGDPPSL